MGDMNLIKEWKDNIAVLIIFLAALLYSVSGFSMQIKQHPISEVYPESIVKQGGFIELTGLSIYPNGCFNFGENEAFLDIPARVIFLNHYSEIKDGLCTFAMTPSESHFSFRKPPPGKYEVKDGFSELSFGSLSINEHGDINFNPK